MKYNNLKETEFFHFFNFQEVKSPKISSREISLKPGGFQEHIDLDLDLNNKGEIIKTYLLLDRDWIGNEISINPFGKDISKSFFDVFLPEITDDEFKPALISSLWNLKGSKDTVICIDKVIHAWESSNMDVKAFLDVYRGTITKASKFLDNDNIMILIENLLESDKNRLKISITFKS